MFRYCQRVVYYGKGGPASFKNKMFSVSLMNGDLLLLQVGSRVFSSQISRPYMMEAEDGLPRITCPQKLVQRLEKAEKRRRDKYHEARRKKYKPKGPQLISCKRKDYNFYQGQDFNENDVSSLVSCGWKNTKRIGDYFTLLAHAENPSLQHGEDQTTFAELGLNSSICSGLEQMGLETPTEIQKLAIPPLMQGENVIIAAETGSGKTLSYLLPCVEWIQRKKHMAPAEDNSLLSSPIAIVVTPNRELTRQVMGVAESLVPHADVIPQFSYSGSSLLRKSPIDLLVTTPGNLNRLLQKRLIHGKRLQHLVIDESDTILDDSFVEDLQTIFNKLNIIPAEDIEENSGYILGTQIALVSATMPRNIQEALANVAPIEVFTKVHTKALHRLPPHVPQKFIRINPDSKPEKLVQLLSKQQEKKQSTLVFVKDSSTCFYVAKMLEEMSISCLWLSGDMTKEQRRGVYKKFAEGYEDILIATDIASRGLDTKHVSHVINYDFPQHMSDYIHRVGRVGRVGSSHTGQVTSLVSHKWEVELLWKIEIAVRSGRYLSDVDANIKQKLEALKAQKDQFELSIIP